MSDLVIYIQIAATPIELETSRGFLKMLFFMPKKAFCDTFGISFGGRFLLGGWWYPALKYKVTNLPRTYDKLHCKTELFR